MDTEKSILKRIQKLLTLSKDKGASKAEAGRAMEMAQRLMTKYNITMANIESDTPASKIKHEYFFSRAVLNPADTEITAILCRFYKVKILYNGNSGMVVIGTPENIEIAKYVHGYLRNVFFKCWNEFKRSANEISAQAERPEGRDGAKHASQFKNTCLRPNKADYYFGLRCGIYERMEQAEKDTLFGEGEESRQNYELALSNNEHELEVYIKNTFRVIGESRRRQGKRMDATSYRAGREKGATLQINQAIKA